MTESALQRAVILIALLSMGATSVDLTGAAVPLVQANDNRTAAGTLKDGTLTVNLVVQMARWYPEADDGGFANVAAIGEEGKAPQVPAPLIRVPAGTTIVAMFRNALADSTIWVRGMTTRPADGRDSVPVGPGETRTFRFAAGEPGTYLYSTATDKRERGVREREQLSGALVVDPVGGRTDDRILVINIWGDRVDSVTYRNALTINGKAWPYTERISANVGDSLRWRVINGSGRGHPMHLHGFYFRVDSRGSRARDTILAADRRRLVVTEDMPPASTMTMVWSPDRPGNWLFHCHVTFHVLGGARLDAHREEHGHAIDPIRHMAGLVVGITVRDSGATRAPASAARPGPVRKLRLFANERAKEGRTPLHMSYVLQRDARPPATDSVEPPGSLILLTRNEPTEITIVNRTHAATSVHWHGIELESYSDGVAGWSGADTRVAPMVAPKDSFTARLTLPRAGTFIYHTHLNDIEQLTSGAYGAIVVLEPGERFDHATDHVFVVGWNGRGEPPQLLVNGDSSPPPLQLEFGRTHRLRFVNIGPAISVLFAMRKDSTPVTWRPRAKDGANLPEPLRTAGPAIRQISVGETFDAEFDPPERGEYRLTIGPPVRPMLITRKVIVR